jgi:hypothetical protein
LTGVLVLQRELGRLERLKALEPPLAMRPVGGALVPALIAQQRDRCQQVEARQGKKGAQEQAHLGYAQTQGRRGREQCRQILTRRG